MKRVGRDACGLLWLLLCMLGRELCLGSQSWGAWHTGGGFPKQTKGPKPELSSDVGTGARLGLEGLIGFRLVFWEVDHTDAETGKRGPE